MVIICDWHGFGTHNEQGQALRDKVLAIAKPTEDQREYRFDGTLEDFIRVWGRQKFLAMPIKDSENDWVVGVTQYSNFSPR